MAMANRTHTELLEKLRNSAALQRSIGLHAGADLLTDAATAIEDLAARDALHAAMNRHPSGQPSARVITTRDEAFALRAGAVVVNGPGKAFQVRTEFGGDRDCIDHATAAFLLPLTVIHEGE
jgi:hypothetical protein